MTEPTGVELTPHAESAPAEQNGAAPVESGGEIMGVLARAVEEGADPDTLEKMIALQERIMDRQARAAFYKAMAAFHEDCPAIQKTRENSQFKVTRNGVRRASRYAPLEEIDRTARPIAARHGFAWTWDTEVGDELLHVTCRLSHEMGHSEETTVSMPYQSKAGSSPQQKFGAAQTYGMRYSLIAALGLTTADEDVDGAAPADDAPAITESQADELDSLIEETGADRAKFLEWIGAESLADIPAADYKRAVKALERKREEAS